MSDTILLSSGDEEHEANPLDKKLSRKGCNVRKSKGPKGAVKENSSADNKENSARGTCEGKGSMDQMEDRNWDGVTGESWSTFQEFLLVCRNTEVNRRNGDAKLITKILEKLKRRFRNADPGYTQSEVFRDAVKTAQNRVEKDPSNLFVHMKQVDEELKIRSVENKTNNHKRKAEGEEDNNKPKKRSKKTDSDASGDQEGEKIVNKMHCKKLEMLFEKVYCKVKKLEEKEVDWDAEENSEYLRLERYKKRLYAIWEKWQEARGRMDEVNKLKYRKIPFSGTHYPDLDHAIEKYVNKTKCFPDFTDIYKVTSQTLNQDKEFPDEQIKSIASAAFQILGNQLQKYRVFDFWNSCLSYLPSTSDGDASISDPAEHDEDLAKALKQNQENYRKRLKDVIDSFVVKQVDEHHEPEEVILKTDDEASAPSGDEGEEEEEEDEKAEDIICISSTSSEDSDGEIETDTKRPQNNKGKHSPNRNLTEKLIKKKSGSDTGSEHTQDYIPLCSRASEKPSGCSGLEKEEKGERSMKVEKDEGSVKVESLASGSSGQKKPKSFQHDLSGKEKSKKLEVVILSESESGE